MVPRMERFQLSKVVTVSSTDGPTVHPRLPDCPSWAARLSTWQAPTVHRSVGQGGPTVAGVSPTVERVSPTVAGVSSPDELDCPLTRRDCPPVSRKSAPDCPPGQPRLPIELGPTAHVSRVRQPESAARLSRCQLDCPLTTLGHRDHLPAAGSYAAKLAPGRLIAAWSSSVLRFASRPSKLSKHSCPAAMFPAYPLTWPPPARSMCYASV